MNHMLAVYSKTVPPTLLPVPEGRTNNERFNALLNSCQNPRAVYDALASFVEAGNVEAV